MRGRGRSALLAATAALGIVLAPSLARGAETFGLAGPAGAKQAKAAPEAPSSRLRYAVADAPQLVLPAVDNRRLLLDDEAAPSRGKVLRYGVARELRVGPEAGAWTDLGDGSRLWLIEVVSPGAVGLRLHFEAAAMPAGAELAVSAAGDAGGRPPEIHRGAAEQVPSSFWSGTVEGERARVEYLAPAGGGEGLPFRLDRLQHLYRDPVRSLYQSKAVAGSCENDVTCFPAHESTARAVSGIGFVQGSDALFCTGQLLNDLAQDLAPYWLTASHCGVDATNAASAELFWLYQTATCNGVPPSLGQVPRSEGATHLVTSPRSDATLLMVEGTLPGGLFWAGWTSEPPAVGTEAVAIHHPAGDFKRISFGATAPVGECGLIPGFAGLDLVHVAWSDGVTEPGSSGSGIFRADSGQLFGQLLGGPSFCNAEPPNRFDCYGSFAATYPHVGAFLLGAADDQSEQNDSCPQARRVETGVRRRRIVTVRDRDWYKIRVPAGKTLIVRLEFVHDHGDIDLAYFGARCGGSPLLTSAGNGDKERIRVTNSGPRDADLFWEVYLSDDVRNGYTMRVDVF